MKYEVITTTFTKIDKNELQKTVLELYGYDLEDEFQDLIRYHGRSYFGEFEVGTDWEFDAQLLRFVKGKPLPEEMEIYTKEYYQPIDHELIEWFLADMCRRGIIPEHTVQIDFGW